MSTIDNMEKTIAAYNKASTLHLVKAAYSADGAFARLWLPTFASMLLTAFYVVSSPGWILLAIPAFIATYLGFNWSLKQAFAPFYSEHGASLLFFRKDHLFLRYLIFRNNLADLRRNKDEIEKLSRAIKYSDLPVFTEFVMQHPVTITCIAFLTGIVGGAANIKGAWQHPFGMPLFTAFVVFVLLGSFMTTDLLRPSQYRLIELQRFLKWLKEDTQPTIE